MDKIIILNGPNLNLLGEREKNQYGSFTLQDIEKKCKDFSSQNDIKLSFFQSNIEGELVEKIQNSRINHDGLIINQYLDDINRYLDNHKDNSKMEKYIKLFEPSYNDLRDCIDLIKRTEPTNSQEINSYAVDFLNIFALVAVGFTWLEFIGISLNKIENKDDDFYFSKIQLGDFYLTKVIFETQKFKNNIYSSGKLYNEFEDKFFEAGI